MVVVLMVIMATRPFAISADSILVFAAGSDDVSTFQPSSPGLPSLISLLKPAEWPQTSAVGKDVSTAELRNLGDGSNAVRDVRVLQARRRRQEAKERTKQNQPINRPTDQTNQANQTNQHQPNQPNQDPRAKIHSNQPTNQPTNQPINQPTNHNHPTAGDRRLRPAWDRPCGRMRPRQL